MKNPLDYTIQDPDALRYALMQDSSFKRGGKAVRKADGGEVKNGEKSGGLFDLGKISANEPQPNGFNDTINAALRKVIPYYEKSAGASRPAQPSNYEQQIQILKQNGAKSFADGGPVHMDDVGDASQADIDRMKFELAQSQFPNSPVIEATPQSPVQGAIGTLGGYLDSAGRFISEALEPIAQSHPGRTFLANMLLANPLKQAGTALQDYTGTVREADEDNPVRGIISKDWHNLTTSRSPILDPRVLDIAQFATPVVSGAAKLAGAGAKAVAPFAKDAAAMANEMYMTGQMPGMVSPNAYVVKPDMSIKDVTNKLTPQQIAHQNAQRNAALPVEQGGLGLHPENTFEDRMAAQNYYDYLHGTQRLDRLLEGKGLDPKRATSGPMPYGTDKPELASKYATDKADTSRYDEGNMADYFQVSPKELGMRGKNPITVEQSWHYLSPDQKNQILSGYYRTGYANPEEASGAFTLHPEGVDGSIVSRNHLEHVLKEERGNPLAALRNIWGESGELYDNPEDLSKIFKLAGYPYEISQTNAPWTTAQGVLVGKARIDKPLITSDVSTLTNDVIPYLREQFKGDRTKLKVGADRWAKESRYTPNQWVDELEKDIKEGKNSYVWTSIPDKITKALSQLGHDGIIDVGGKGGGENHQVVIPFHPKQVRSKFAAFDPLEKESTDLLKAKGGIVHMKAGGKVKFANDINAMKYELAKAK